MSYSIGNDGPKFDEEEFRKAFEKLDEENWEGRDWDDYKVFVELPEKKRSKPLKAVYYNLEQDTSNLHTHRIERELKEDFLIYRKGNYFSNAVEMASRHYPENKSQRDKEEFSGNHKSILLIHKIEEFLKDYVGSQNLITDRVGRNSGRFPNTPWISVMDSRITDTTREGVYIVFFIDVRDKDLYMTIGQGASQIESENTRSEAKEILRERREAISNEFDFSPFKVGEPDLNIVNEGSRTQDEMYPPATIAYKKWNLKDIPSDAEMIRNFNLMVDKYKKWIFSWDNPVDFLKYNPKARPRKIVGSPDHFITSAERRCWGFEDISDDISEGDVVIIHASSNSKHDDLKNMRTGLIGVGIVEEGAKDYKNEPWWLAEFTSDSAWPDILKFKKLFLTGDTEKLDLSRNVYHKFKEDKEIINEEMEAILNNSVKREKADEIAQEVNEEDKGFPWRVNGGRFLDAEDNVCYELPIKIIEEMMTQ
jgi:hypothetical protein